MINRVLIRIRIVQILFASQLNDSADLQKNRNEFMFGLEKSYDLYFYLLYLMIVLSDEYKHRVDGKKSKLMPSFEDMNPETKLLDNKFITQLRSNKVLDDYMNERPFDWMVHEGFVRNLLNEILASDIYKDYLSSPENSYENDKEFWRKVFKKLISANEELDNLLEDESVFWNGDIDIIESFVLKTIKRFEESAGGDQELQMMFKDKSDKEYAIKLLDDAFLNQAKYRQMIEKYTKNWESERIALMDMIIMQVAIAEIMSFPTIPINVTLNEFIDISKCYSTNKSGSFINGILDAIVKELKEEGKLLKN